MHCARSAFYGWNPQDNKILFCIFFLLIPTCFSFYSPPPPPGWSIWFNTQSLSLFFYSLLTLHASPCAGHKWKNLSCNNKVLCLMKAQCLYWVDLFFRTFFNIQWKKLHISHLCDVDTDWLISYNRSQEVLCTLHTKQRNYIKRLNSNHIMPLKNCAHHSESLSNIWKAKVYFRLTQSMDPVGVKGQRR